MARYRIEAHGARYEIEAHPESLLARRLKHGVPYEPWLLENAYERKLSGCAVDVGAHIGNHSLWFSVVCGLRVVAFEPLFHHELRANIALNDCAVTVHPVALGEAEGTADDGGDRVLSVPGRERHRRHHHARAEGKLSPGPGEIPVHTLDSYELRDVALVKIDVEEMEPAVLRGAEHTIARERPVIYAEARDQDAHEAVAAVLEPWGYRMAHRWKRGTQMESWEPC